MGGDRYGRNHRGSSNHRSGYEMEGDRCERNHRRSSNHRSDAPYWRGDRNRGAVDRYESGSSSGGGTNYHSKSCTIEFDGSSKGNPGQAGAGAVVRAADGSRVARLRVGLGNATNNEAEYRGAIIGLEYALEDGCTDVCIQGDSELVCKQGYNTEADAQANRAARLKNGEVEVERE